LSEDFFVPGTAAGVIDLDRIANTMGWMEEMTKTMRRPTRNLKASSKAFCAPTSNPSRTPRNQVGH